MGMCRWMGSHFHDLIDYNETAFSTELLEWGRTFSNVRIMAVLVGRANKPGRARAVMPRGDWSGSACSLAGQNRHATQGTHLRNFAGKEAGGSYPAKIVSKPPSSPPPPTQILCTMPPSLSPHV